MATPLQIVTTAVQPAPQGQSNVLARLQALFPTSPSASNSDTSKGLPPPPRTSSRLTPRAQHLPKPLKVRIVTWNMHDSLPKGDLEELLGAVPPHTPKPLLEEPSWPNLTLDGHHPYHMIIIAGQECPSMSGIPMGLGAGFKLKDLKDKERDKENIKESKDKGDKHKSKQKDKEKDKGGCDDDLSHDIYAPPGWTSILEDWLCNGSGCTVNTKSSSLFEAGTSPSPPFPPPIHRSTGNLPERTAGKEQCKGPYQPLTKHRMMGLYLTVYIHRDIRTLVRGTSKSAVTAGLIGGRVGNKGGVGISLNIDGTTFLLINAHLAAHEGKVPHRLANLTKIKAELSVDDYLAADDARVMAEDITDKFDYTFLCGDLNFRLDISRLHADWLISRQEYAQALAFDQLRKLMQEGKGFVGFNEGPINFAPTFKYDVLRTLKRSKTKGSRHNWKFNAERHNPLYEVEELDRDDDDDDEGDDDGEGASMTSSVWTSVHSKAPTDGDDSDFFNSPPAQAVSTPNLAHKISVAAAAHKAKTKWLALLAPVSAPSTPTIMWRKSKHSDTIPSAPSVREPIPARSSTDIGAKPSVNAKSTSTASPRLTSNRLSRPRGPIRSTSTKSVQQSGDEDTDEEDKGVYDSSNKKRVPSWCDRILWKSTIHPDPEEFVDLHRPRTRVSQFFVNALRPLTNRGRRESTSSTSSSELYPLPPENAYVSTPSSAHAESTNVLDDASPFARFVKRSRSNDVLQATETPSPTLPSLTRSKSSSSQYKQHRSGSAGQSFHSPSSPSTCGTPSHLSSPVKDTGHVDLPHPISPKEPTLAMPSRWRFLPFFNRDVPDSPTEHREPTPDHVSPPKKGDVICLSYNTLDDRGMRRLEGRSDHRPVIGSYAVYI